MESESFPPSTATPMAFMKLDMAAHASYMAAPSPSSLAAHIQLAEHFTSPRPPTDAHTRLVTASAVARRAIAAGSSRPLIGCSPTAVAAPEKSVWVCAMTPQLASGMWSGPTHCCCAMRPVTERSTLLVRKRFDPTEGRRRTRPSASATVSPSGRDSGLDGKGLRSETKVLGGSLPRTISRGREYGVEPSSESSSVTMPSPVTWPRKAEGQDSRAQMASKRGLLSGRRRRHEFSWYSAPHSSRIERVASPELMARACSFAPSGSTISLHTFPLPPAPWSWMETMGLLSPISTHARITRFILFSISASPRCTASKSRAARSASSPPALEEAAPPPRPMR
mmetsp:Transcript_19825/g.63179  ORF Transcript_19825/g.63179 Transcript_19825/m.63179 type:complete len:338 (+) Transcript_19825:396-1409(+)